MIANLKPYQLKTVAFGLNNPYSILALEMGLGKSLCALKIWEKLGGFCVIVCPAYLVLNWKSEIEKWYGDKYKISAVTKGKDIIKDVINKTDVCIISYSLAQKAEFIFEKAQILVVDEAHGLSSMESLRTGFMHRVIYENSIPNVYLLTGTPIKNRIREYYSLLAICNYNPTIVGSKFLDKFPDALTFADYFSFREEYTIEIKNKFVKIMKWSGHRRIDELKSYLKGRYIRFDSSKVLDLPPYIVKDVLISDKADPKLLEQFNAYFEEGENSSVKVTYKAEAALKKVPFTVQYVKGLLEEVSQICIYTDHVESCKALAKAFDCEPITGAMPAVRRSQLAARFQAGEDRIICATMKSFSTGVNLTAASNLVIHDPSWIPSEIKQTIFRIVRIGQNKQCVIHRVCNSPQDQKIYKVLEEKMETINIAT